MIYLFTKLTSIEITIVYKYILQLYTKNSLFNPALIKFVISKYTGYKDYT